MTLSRRAIALERRLLARLGEGRGNRATLAEKNP